MPIGRLPLSPGMSISMFAYTRVSRRSCLAYGDIIKYAGCNQTIKWRWCNICANIRERTDVVRWYGAAARLTPARPRPLRRTQPPPRSPAPVVRAVPRPWPAVSAVAPSPFAADAAGGGWPFPARARHRCSTTGRAPRARAPRSGARYMRASPTRCAAAPPNPPPTPARTGAERLPRTGPAGTAVTR